MSVHVDQVACQGPSQKPRQETGDEVRARIQARRELRRKRFEAEADPIPLVRGRMSMKTLIQTLTGEEVPYSKEDVLDAIVRAGDASGSRLGVMRGRVLWFTPKEAKLIESHLVSM